MQNDTAIMYAYLPDPLTGETTRHWVGNGTREAIKTAGYCVGGLVGWHPHELLLDGWALRVDAT